ncbi:hypothetical protein MMC08_006031 [Hypocenomyce scalaris]|nr:hypothetical protein [Hypocenomyce scalaris]
MAGPHYNGSGPVPPYNMTSPLPAPFTPYTDTTALEDYFYNEIAAIVSNTSYFTTKCSKCIAATGVMHLAAITLPVSTLRTCSSGFAPPGLALSSFSTMDQFINKSDMVFTVFTGDIVSHDNNDQLSRVYVEYEENVTYALFKAEMGNGVIYPTLGNHDSLPEAYNTPNNINGGKNDSWINATEQQYAAIHYGAYTNTTAEGLRIISINTNFWYVDNVFYDFNFMNPDQSGMLSFLISKLEACEAIGQRAWIIGHVLSGYNGTNPLPNPTALSIPLSGDSRLPLLLLSSSVTVSQVRRMCIAHEDRLQIFYDYAPTNLGSGAKSTIRNTTDVDYNHPLTMAFIGPSITPLTGPPTSPMNATFYNNLANAMLNN